MTQTLIDCEHCGIPVWHAQYSTADALCYPCHEHALKHGRGLGRIFYDDERGHFCTLHGPVTASDQTYPFQEGSGLLYICGVCRAMRWSGI